MINRRLKRDWLLTEDSLNKLLDALNPDRQSAAEQYEHLRRSLIRYFDWRGLISCERDADTTIDRVARRLGDQSIADVHAYALGVARKVALESLRVQQREQEECLTPFAVPESNEEMNLRVACFETCLGQLPTAKKELILAYYDGAKQTKIAIRRQLADQSGMPISRLRIQAHRIRETLERCINNCCSSATDNAQQPIM